MLASQCALANLPHGNVAKVSLCTTATPVIQQYLVSSCKCNLLNQEEQIFLDGEQTMYNVAVIRFPIKEQTVAVKTLALL